MRTNFYVDGFNFYYGSLRGTPFRWLNVAEFARRSLPPPANVLGHVHYFTARVKGYPSDPQQPVRQAALLDALATLPEVTVHFGQYRSSKVYLRLAAPPVEGPDRVLVWRHEEKGSDVNLATRLLVDGFRGEYDAAAVVSNDSDLVEPLRVVRYELGKPVVVLFPVRPGGSGGNELKRVASKYFNVDPAHLAAAQFPPAVAAGNRTVRKPAAW